ncbi:GyrI-like domain-containing protein [Halobacillus salinus]|uniref:GyrI-like domain-containing protein n=1 Tax=Halobacillus salinus TaxID=192814 RepID=UPI0009A76E6D|nr:hypothetical protein [Halobacillus salinus]
MINYQTKTHSVERYFVGVQYQQRVESLQEVDLPAFWTTFTDIFYNTEVPNLVPKKEAIGYMDFSQDGSEFEYIAGCEVTRFDQSVSLERVIVPQGEYVYFDLPFKRKAEHIEGILHFLKQQWPNLDRTFAYEYYPESFDHNQEDTMLYFVVPFFLKA